MKLIVTILLNSVIVILVLIMGVVGYQLYQAYDNDHTDIRNLINPSYFLSLINFNYEEEWVPYESSTYSFQHPKNWHPKPKDIGEYGESIDLNIPVIFNLPRIGDLSIIAYSKNSIIQSRPPNLLDEKDYNFAGRRGLRWIYKNPGNYFVYHYIIPLNRDNSNFRQLNSFVLIVESVKRDPELEKTLNKLADSIVLKDFHP